MSKKKIIDRFVIVINCTDLSKTYHIIERMWTREILETAYIEGWEGSKPDEFDLFNDQKYMYALEFVFYDDCTKEVLWMDLNTYNTYDARGYWSKCRYYLDYECSLQDDDYNDILSRIKNPPEMFERINGYALIFDDRHKELIIGCTTINYKQIEAIHKRCVKGK